MRLTTWTLNKGLRQWLGFFIFFYACLLALPASATISPGTIDFGEGHGTYADVSTDYNGLSFTGQWIYYTDGDLTSGFGGVRVSGSDGDAITSTDDGTGNATIKSVNGTDRFSLTSVKIFAYGVGMTQFTFAGYRNGSPTGSSDTVNVTSANSSFVNFTLSNMTNVDEVRVSNNSAEPYNFAFDDLVVAPYVALSLSPTTLSAATVAAAYNQTITASGGILPYTYAVTAGALPAGMSLSSAGVLSGTPTAGGSFNFTITATDSTGGTPVTGSQAYTLTIMAAPTATTGSASTITSTGATLGGTVSSNGASTTVTFEYGLTSGYGLSASASQSPLAAGASNSSVSGAITGLTCNTTYHFRVKAVNSVDTTYGNDATFTTSPCAPTATTGSATSITASGATLGGTVSSNGASTTVTFEYGQDLGYGSSATASQSPLAAGASNSSVSAALSGLSCNTTYYFRVKAVNSVGTTNGLGATFTTADCSVPGAPTIGTATAGDAQASVTFTPPASDGGATITGYKATSSPGGITGTCASSPCVVSGLSNGSTYSFTVTATNSAGTGSASAASNSVTPKAPQTITFNNPGAQNFGTSPTLSASTDSGLSVSFTSSTSGVCTITSGGDLTFVTEGSCTINADQAGNGSYLAAPQVSQTFTVNAVVPGAPTIGTATAGDTQASVAFTAPASNGGSAIMSYTVTSSPGGLIGTGSASPISVTGLTNGTAYTFTVSATNGAGIGSASVPSNSVTPAASQTITFNNPGAQNFGTSPVLSASSDSGLSVSFTSSTTGVCTITSGGVLTFASVGTCTINAVQAGNASYLAATPVSRTFSVNVVVPGAPTIGTATAGDTQASVAFTAPTNTGGTSITGYTVMVSPPVVPPVNGASSPIVVTGLTNGQAYTFTVTGDNSAGTGPASATSNSVTPAASQTITFANPGAQNFGTSPVLSASSDSGLSVSFTSSTTGVCTITSGGVLSFADVGTCTINAVQAGDASYLAATPVSRTFSVNAVVPGAPTIGTATAGNAQATVSFSAPAFSGGAAITGYTLVSIPGGITASGAASPITISGLTNGTSYSFTVAAKNPAGTGGASAASNSVKPNGAPIITSTALARATQDAAYSYTLVATDSDVGDSLTLSAVTLPNWLNFNEATGVLSGTPSDTQVGSHAVVLRATDRDGLTAEQSFTLVVTKANAAPIITSVALTSATQDAAYSYTLVATDSDVGDSLTLSAVTLPNWLNFNAATGVLSGTPGNTQVGSHAVVLRATDRDGLSAEQRFTLVVTKANAAPTITSTALTSATQDAAYSYTLVATDSDVGDSLTLSAVTLPNWLNFNAATGVLSGTPGIAQVGSHTVVLRAMDRDGLSAEQRFTLVVTKANAAPTITSTALTSATQDAAYSYTLVATDSDVGDSLTLSAVTLPNWLNFNAATGVLSGTPGNTQVGSHAVVLRATDRDGLSAEQRFTLVVTKANAAPTITSTALTSATQDAAYSYTLVATDSDVGDSLTLSAVTLPNWLNFNAATGVLSGTPGNTQVGSHAVVLRATDADGLSVDQSFTIVVANVNDAPVAADQVITVEEDGSVMITPAAEDADHDPLTYEITAQPSSGTLEQHGNVWLYMPKQDFNGTDSFGFIAKDAELSSEPATVTITVAPVNDAPQAVDDSYTLTSTANDTYSLAVLANDVDVDGDKLTIVGAATDIGSVQVTSDGLSLTLPEAYVGPVALRYTLSDGHVRATAKVNVLIEGESSDNQPVITMPDDVEVDATGLFTRVNLGFAKAVDRNGAPLPVSLVDKNLFFAPGNHSVYWQAVDHDGNKAIKEQKVKVKPLISLSKDQAVSEGNQVTVSVHLNGDAPSYPVSIPYTVSGSADSSDHDLVDGVVEITSGRAAQIHFNTLNDGVAEGNEDVLITLDPSLNLGSKQQIRVMITEVNIAPDVDLKVTQAGLPQLIVAQDGGDVHIRATTSDANVQDNVTLAWESGTLSLQADPAGMFFSPQSVQPGIYPVSLTATDDGTPVMSSTATVYIVVRPSLAVLTSADTDGDLIPDDQEGYGDSDSDGIPDYLDATSDCNVMPEMALQPEHFLAEGQAGVCLRLGSTALQSGQSGVQLPLASVVNDTVAANVGGIFDFIATGLPQAGQSYSLVLPQQLPIPANAVYRKYSSKAGWRNFVIDERNSVASAEGERGFCPSPGDSRWTPGLTEGHWCVQLLIEDGGPNDDDGGANRTIVDPSGVAVTLNGNNVPIANPDSASIGWNQSLDIDVLANDTDSDGDSLAITQVVSEFGTATVLANQQISYKPEPDFIGTDVLVYSITDGKGGTASSELTIVVDGNTAPVTVNDSASTDDRSSLLIDVLSNDTDVDGNALTLVSATAKQGLVAIESNKLRYTPKTGFVGVDTVTYRISDGFGGETTGQVSITVTAYHGNKSGGGSINLWALAFILACGVMRRRALTPRCRK